MRATSASMPLQPIVFTTRDLPPAQQFDAWAERWRPMIDLRPVADAAGPFEATNAVWDLGSFALSHVVAPGLVTRRDARQLRRDQLDAWMLPCAIRGDIAYEAQAGSASAPAGVPFPISLGRPFESRRGDIEWGTLFFSRDLCPTLNRLLDAAASRPLNTPLGRLLGDFIGSLRRRLPELSTADLPAAEGAIRQMIAACVAPSSDRLAEAAPALDQTRLERARVMIRRTLHLATLSPERLGRMVGMSRSNLYRLFEAEGGVASYIQRQRLNASCAALSDPADRRPIRAIAESVGFVDAAVFARAFRQHFGVRPSDMRADEGILARTRVAGPGVARGSAVKEVLLRRR